MILTTKNEKSGFWTIPVSWDVIAGQLFDPIGKKIVEDMNDGRFVSDEIVNSLIKNNVHIYTRAMLCGFVEMNDYSGVGVSCVNALSKHLKATVFRNGEEWEQEYERGKALYPVRKVGNSSDQGTLIKFTPDPTIFTSILEYSYDTLANRLRELSFLNKWLVITLNDDMVKGEKIKSDTFHSKDGLREFIHFLDESRESLIKDVISMEGEKNGIPVEVAMIYNNSYSENLHSYVNNINTHEAVSYTHLTLPTKRIV